MELIEKTPEVLLVLNINFLVLIVGYGYYKIDHSFSLEDLKRCIVQFGIFLSILYYFIIANITETIVSYARLHDTWKGDYEIYEGKIMNYSVWNTGSHIVNTLVNHPFWFITAIFLFIIFIFNGLYKKYEKLVYRPKIADDDLPF